MQSLPAALRTKPLRQLGRSRKPSVASKWIPRDAVIMLTSFLLSYQGLGESFYWPLRQSKTKHAEIEIWMLMDGNPIMLWFNFSSGKCDCFCSPAARLTEAREKTPREGRQRCGGKHKNWENIPNPPDKLSSEEAQVCLYGTAALQRRAVEFGNNAGGISLRLVAFVEGITWQQNPFRVRG